jgi:hypothetical protein
MRIQHQTNRRKKVALSALILALVVAGAFGVYTYLHRDDTKRDSSGTSLERTPQDLKLEEELKNDAAKKEQNTQTDQSTTPTVNQDTNLQQVNVVLTNTGQDNNTISASGFVSNAVEEGGVCKYIFSNGQKTIQKTSTTLVNASSTTCKTIRFDKSELTTGPWKVQIEYISSVSTGKSNILEVDVT